MFSRPLGRSGTDLDKHLQPGLLQVNGLLNFP